eukprot:COSAG02_NODE_6539_length_3509_cov_1.903226_3_plen_138_part_00
MLEATPCEDVAFVPSSMEPEPEPGPSAPADPLQIARDFFATVKSGGVSKHVHAYALVRGEREAGEYTFPCRCEKEQDACPNCCLHLPDEQLPDGKHLPATDSAEEDSFSHCCLKLTSERAPRLVFCGTEPRRAPPSR